MEITFVRNPVYSFGPGFEKFTRYKSVCTKRRDVNPGVGTYNPEKLTVLKKSPMVALMRAKRFNTIKSNL